MATNSRLRLPVGASCKTEASAAAAAHAVTASSVPSIASTHNFPSPFMGEVLLEYSMPADQDSSGIPAAPVRTSTPPRQVSSSSVLAAKGCLSTSVATTCALRLRARGGRSERASTSLPFHMMPYDLQAHLLQHGEKCNGEQRSAATMWFPLRPPSLAAVAATASISQVSEQGSSRRGEPEVDTDASRRIPQLSRHRGHIYGGCLQTSPVPLTTPSPERILQRSRNLALHEAQAVSTRCSGGHDAFTSRSCEPCERSADKPFFDTATSAGCAQASPEADRMVTGETEGQADYEYGDGNTVLVAFGLVVVSGFVQAAELQLVCIEMSNACREEVEWSLHITEATPPQLVNYLWRRSRMIAPGPLAHTRLQPHRKIVAVSLMDGRAVMFATWPATMRRLEFGDRFNSAVEGVLWPPGLEYISFGPRFNQPVARVTWPRALNELVFGNDFNQPISGIDLPVGLQRLDFGGRFNQPIAAVNWPTGLRELRFGKCFNRSVVNVRWPDGLVKLDFDGEFQQRIEDVSWPPALEHLGLLGNFNQPINAMQWPPGLKTIVFGDSFQRSLTTVRWPASLETVVLGCDFNRKLSGVVWPPALKKLVVPIDRVLGDERSNIPYSCVVETLFGPDFPEEGGFGSPQPCEDAPLDDPDEYGLLENEDADAEVDVFGYQNEPWDMVEVGWGAGEAWDGLDLGQTNSR